MLEIQPWTPEEVDNERLTWLQCYGVPCHAWSFKFFGFISCFIGKIICLDEETHKRTRMDVARILVRTKYSLVLNQTFNVEINDKVYSIKMVEDMHGPKRLVVLISRNDEEDLSVYSTEREDDVEGESLENDEIIEESSFLVSTTKPEDVAEVKGVEYMDVDGLEAWTKEGVLEGNMCMGGGAVEI